MVSALVGQIRFIDDHQYVLFTNRDAIKMYKGAVDKYDIVSRVSKEEYELYGRVNFINRTGIMEEVVPKLLIPKRYKKQLVPEKLYLGELCQFFREEVGLYKLAYTPHDNTFFFYDQLKRVYFRNYEPYATYEMYEKLVIQLLNKSGYRSYKTALDRIYSLGRCIRQHAW